MSELSFLTASYEELSSHFSSQGIEPYRLKQIWQWIFKKKVFSFNDMTSLSQDVRTALKQHYSLLLPCIVDVKTGADETKKYLMAMHDDAYVEAVVLSHEDHNTLCISSQVGCRYACSFCATGASFKRNLTAEEIVGEFLVIAKHNDIRNVVFMGMGEPLDNYDHVLSAIRILNDPLKTGMSQRKITVSTCGLVPQIKKLADEKLQITLAVSLNATTDDLRSQMMPVNKQYSLAELRKALLYYIEQTGRKITVEYVLLGGVNTTREDAVRLREFCKGLICNINLIPFNPHPRSSYTSPTRAELTDFSYEVEQSKTPVVMRYRRGADIEAACGQLAGHP